MVDAAFLLRVISGHIQQLIPEYPLRADEIVPAVLCLITVVFSRRNGVAYGAVFLRWLLAALFLLSTVFVSANGVGARLWPFWGQGVSKTALVALSGAGGLWGVGLFFVLPPSSMPGAPSRRPLPGTADYRRTLYWNPEVKFNAQGEAQLRFYNNNKRTTLSIEAEGITRTGLPVTTTLSLSSK